MLMPDVNVLVYAHRKESSHHAVHAKWLAETATGIQPFALSEPVMQGFLRVVTNSRVFRPASTLEQALDFLNQLVSRENCIVVRPGPQHWNIFRELIVQCDASGKLIADAAHAALAIETGCEWVTADTDFARFAPALRWRLI